MSLTQPCASAAWCHAPLSCPRSKSKRAISTVTCAALNTMACEENDALIYQSHWFEGKVSPSFWPWLISSHFLLEEIKRREMFTLGLGQEPKWPSFSDLNSFYEDAATHSCTVLGYVYLSICWTWSQKVRCCLMRLSKVSISFRPEDSSSVEFSSLASKF